MLLITFDQKLKERVASITYVWKHIQNLGSQIQYNGDHDFSLHLRMLCALTFLRTNDFLNGFVTLCQEIRNNFNADTDDFSG